MDFTKLETLELEAHLTPGALRHLATQFHFPYLTTLVLGRIQGERKNSDDHAEAVNKLLTCLPPLEFLTLDGWYSEVSIKELAIVHGPSLLELKLLNYSGKDSLTNSDLEALGRYCVRLRDFELSLRRSIGDSKEASLYKTLGSIPNLQFINLDLHVDQSFTLWDNEEDEDGNMWNRTFDDEFDKKVPLVLQEDGEACNGVMREQLINCTIDAKLARSIVFDTISVGKHPISRPMQELKINII